MTDFKNLIIIDITDHEDAVLAPRGIGATGDHVIKELKARGTLLVKNQSQKSRLWNLTCDVRENVGTNLPRVINVGSVNPASEFTQEYEIKSVKTPCLDVVETVDVERTIKGVTNNTFLYENENECTLTISLTNTLEKPFTKITVSKEMSPFFQDIQVEEYSIGNVELKDEEEPKMLRWMITDLKARETAMITVTFTVVPEERKDYSFGPLRVEYLIENHFLAGFDPEIRGLTDSISGVTRDEGARPGTWDCNVEFINDSEFKVILEAVNVAHKISTGFETVVSEMPRKELAPEQSWEKNFKVASEHVPDLESEITFTPLFEVNTKTIGVIVKEPTWYHVLSAEISKNITPAEVAAYANTPMTITNTISNVGTSPFDALEIIDKIPPDFVPPSLNEIIIRLQNEESTMQVQHREEFAQLIDVIPPDQDPDSKHVINVKLKELEQIVSPNSTIMMTYPLLAKNPKPEVRYNTSVEIRVNVPIKGKEFIISPPKEPVLEIKYIQRKLKTLKSVKPGASGGEFSISIRIENKSEIELENVIIKDMIPEGFVLSETRFDLPHKLVAAGKDSEIQVNIAELQGNETITIGYNCTGQGDYPRSEPTVIVKGRTSTKE